jgi:hypothetical protein
MEPDAQITPQPPAAVDLPGAGRRQLVAALLAAYDEAGLAQLARFALDEDLPEIAGGRNLREVAFNLVEWAASHGRLADLVTGALADRPGNPELQVFARDVWPTRRTVTPAELATLRSGDAAPPPHKTATFWRTLPGILTGIAGVLTAVVALIAALTNAGRLGTAPPTVTNPRVVVSNAVLRKIETAPTGEEFLDIAYQIEMTGYGQQSVLVEGTALDAATKQEVRLIGTIPSMRVTDDETQDMEVGQMLVPMPQRRGCIYVRVAALDQAGDELSYDETLRFDPYDLAAECPQESGGTQSPVLLAQRLVAVPLRIP